MIKKIPEEVKLPFDADAITAGRRPLAAYIRKLINSIEDQFEINRDTTNLLVDNTDGEGLYSRARDSSGQYPLGTWRLVQDGDDWVRERLTDVDKDTWEFTGRWKPAKT